MNHENEAHVLAAEVVLYQDEELQVSEGWSIEDLGSADWALERVAALEKEIADNDALAELAIERIRLKNDNLNRRAQRGVDFFRRKLEAFAVSHRELLLGTGKKKSRSLLNGTLGFRKRGGGLEVTDRETALDWAREQPAELGLVRLKEELAVDELKKRFKETGEVPPGTEVAPEVDEVVVKAARPGGSNGNE